MQGELAQDGGESGRALVFGTDAEAAAWWGVSRRSIIRHRQRGAPLTRPPAMADWWAGEYGRRVPEWILEGAARFAGVVERPRPAEESAAAVSPPAEGEGISEFEILESADWGVTQQIRMQRGIAKAYAIQLADAAKKGKDISALDRRYQAAAKQLQTYEARQQKILIDSGEAWPRHEVEAVVLDLMHAVNAGLDYLPVQLRRELSLSQDQERLARDLIDRLRELWRDCKLVPAEVERRLTDAA